MNRSEIRIIQCLSIILLLVASICVYHLMHPKFKKPPFAENAVLGEPAIDYDACHFQEIVISPEFSLNMCGKPAIIKDEICLYFTARSSNNIWLRYIVYDEAGKVVSESGIIKPGEYLVSSKLERELNDGEIITVKVLSFEPETYYSEGSLNVNIQIQK